MIHKLKYELNWFYFFLQIFKYKNNYFNKTLVDPGTFKLLETDSGYRGCLRSEVWKYDGKAFKYLKIPASFRNISQQFGAFTFFLLALEGPCHLKPCSYVSEALPLASYNGSFPTEHWTKANIVLSRRIVCTSEQGLKRKSALRKGDHKRIVI